MATHPRTVRLLTEWLSTTDELTTDVADFNALYDLEVLESDRLMRDFPMLRVRRLVLSHASSVDVLHVAQHVDTGSFLAVVVNHDDEDKAVIASVEFEREQRYLR